MMQYVSPEVGIEFFLVLFSVNLFFKWLTDKYCLNL
jgi:hypothetical protein